MYLTFFQDEQTDSVKEELTTAEVLQKVKEYNAQINSNLFMNMVSDDSLQTETYLHKIFLFVKNSVF